MINFESPDKIYENNLENRIYKEASPINEKEYQPKVRPWELEKKEFVPRAKRFEAMKEELEKYKENKKEQ